MSRNLLPLYIVLLSLGAVSLVGGVTLDDYCTPDAENTPCRTKCQQGADCKSVFEVVAMTDAERNDILNLHNDLRNSMATGEASANVPLPDAEEAPAERRKRLAFDAMPKCATMKVMSYSKELEFLAECHIRSCTFEHDPVRFTADGEIVGQNLYMKSTSVDEFPADLGKAAATAWFKEYLLVNAEEELTVFGGGKGIGHFTAMIWGTTNLVGCAKMHTSDGQTHDYYYFCDYAPAGNIVGATFCEEGEECADDHPPEFAALCGQIRALSDDTFVAPEIPAGAWRMAGLSVGFYSIWYLALRFVQSGRCQED